METPAPAARPRASSLRMAAAVLAGWATTFVALTLAAFVFLLVAEPSHGITNALENASGVLAYGVMLIGAPALAISAALGLVSHHVLSRSGRERQLRWYIAIGAGVVGILLPITVQIVFKDARLSGFCIPVGALLGAANATGFGAVIRRDREPAAVAPPPDPR